MGFTGRQRTLELDESISGSVKRRPSLEYFPSPPHREASYIPRRCHVPFFETKESKI